MGAAASDLPQRRVTVEEVDRLNGADMDDLREAAELAIGAESGFGWLKRALQDRFSIDNIDIRETQAGAIALCGTLSYTHWGTHPRYARVEGKYVPGRFILKI